VLAHAAELGLSWVCSLIVPDNERSRAVARRLGMTIERQVDWNGRLHDLWTLDLT
jgi:RimJ/RimL family protein N-acetyltransferase